MKKKTITTKSSGADSNSPKYTYMRFKPLITGKYPTGPELLNSTINNDYGSSIIWFNKGKNSEIYRPINCNNKKNM